MNKIGIIAGGGQLPKLLALEAKKSAFEVLICGFEGHTDSDIANYADFCQVQNIGALGKLLDFFRKHQVQDLCLAGTITKPKVMDIRPDFRAAKLVFSLKGKGDDALLRTVLGELEKEGFNIKSVAELLPALRCPKGLLTKRKFSEQENSDLEYGLPILQELGRLDIGQCLLVKKGVVLAVECLEGTDATIARGAKLGGENSLVIKIVKPKQDERVDLPSIGLQTIQTLIDNKLSALAIEAEKSLFFDRENAIKLANQHNIAIYAF